MILIPANLAIRVSVLVNVLIAMDRVNPSVKMTDLQQRQQADLERRKKLVQKVQIAKKQLAMDDDSYRAMLKDVTGFTSSTRLQVWELENVLKRMRKLGFKDKIPNQAGSRPLADDDQSKMIRALWLELHTAGKVRDPSESALVNWARGQFKTTQGIEALQWFNVYQRRRLIEQLKRWLARK